MSLVGGQQNDWQLIWQTISLPTDACDETNAVPSAGTLDLLDPCDCALARLSGYVWGRTDEAIGVSVVNERQTQTDYGAVDYLSGEVLLRAFDAGNSENTVNYLRY